MAGSTTNLGLTKPTYSEDADIAVINTNMDTLDSKIGAVGSTSLQAQITSANEAIATLNSKIRGGSDGSVNLNNYITTGMYAFNGGTSLNAPASGASTLIVQRYSDDWISQMVTVITSNGSEVYVRDYHDGTTWSSWEKLAQNSDIGNYSVQDGSANWGTEVTITRKANARMRITGARSGLGFEIVVPKDTNEYVTLSNVNSALSSVTVAMSSVKFTSKSSGYGTTIDWMAETWS